MKCDACNDVVEKLIIKISYYNANWVENPILQGLDLSRELIATRVVCISCADKVSAYWPVSETSEVILNE
jgi:hypothetical protein